MSDNVCVSIDHSDEAQAYEMKEDILDRHYYDESYLHSLGMASSKILGKTVSSYKSYANLEFF